MPSEEHAEQFNYHDDSERDKECASHTHEEVWEKRSENGHNSHDGARRDYCVYDRYAARADERNAEHCPNWHNDQIVADKANNGTVALGADDHANDGECEVADDKSQRIKSKNVRRRVFYHQGIDDESPQEDAADEQIVAAAAHFSVVVVTIIVSVIHNSTS